ncbi:MAG: protein-export chaperone SecB [Halothiobacillaceae bacterium]|nr:MAG: protein-export chaperone SecB [Halothiobacillaceae bacterium]
MTDAQHTQRTLFLQRIYLKDVSFESPRAPGIFQIEDWQPSVNVQIGNATHKLADDVYEITLTVTVTANLSMDGKDETAFLTEVSQAGIFTVAGFEAAELGHILGSVCPTQLFPFVRETVADLVSKGGFPPLLLQPINFDALYIQHLQQREAAGAATH